MAAPLAPVPPELVARVRALADGDEHRAAKALELDRVTVLRILAGYPVTRGTLLQLERLLCG